jgi:hypothetical protein
MKLTLIGLMIIAAVATASVESPHQAAALVLEQMLDGNIEGRSLLSFPEFLYEGQPVASWHEDVVAPFAGYLVLVDDAALANWEHPCRWVFVSSDGTMESVHMTTPPTGLSKMSMEYSSLPEHSTVRSDILDWFVANPRQTDAANCKALIISGGYNSGNNHIRYYGDVQFLYLTLTQDYGYTNDDIIICFADGLNPAPDQSGGLNSNPDLDGDGDNDFDYDATLGSVTTAMAQMATLAGPADHVLYFTTDHGGAGKTGMDVAPEVILNLWNTQTLNDDVFDTFIDTFDCASLHVVMEQCYSGGFLVETVPAAGQEPRTFSSAANASESSWAGATYPQYDEWSYWWTGAMHGSVPAGGSYPGGALPGDPDGNSDGYVDYKEAWDAAYAWDSYAQSGQEHPQWDDYPDSCGSNYCLSGMTTTGIGEGSGPIAPSAGLFLLGNPLSASTTVSFSLSTSGVANLGVFDVTGRLVGTIAEGDFSAGTHSVVWDTHSLSSGVYIVRLHAGDVVETFRAVKF